MKAVERQLADIKKYQSIVNQSDNPYIINDYTKAIRRLQGELKTYCKFKGYDYNDIVNRGC